jgi:hypothetical protein
MMSWRTAEVLHSDRKRRPEMHPRTVTALALVGLALAVAACSGTGQGLYPVYGKVTYKGEPARGAYVVLAREREGSTAPGQPPGNAADEPPSATVEEDGSFTISCGDRGYGAPPGRYKVTIVWPGGLGADEAKAREAAEKKKQGQRARISRADKHAMLAPDRLKGRFAEASRSRLLIEVKAETNNLPPFDLTD